MPGHSTTKIGKPTARCSLTTRKVAAYAQETVIRCLRMTGVFLLMTSEIARQARGRRRRRQIRDARAEQQRRCRQHERRKEAAQAAHHTMPLAIPACFVKYAGTN